MDAGHILAWTSIAVVSVVGFYLAHAVSRSVIIGVPPDYFVHDGPAHSTASHAVRMGLGAVLVVFGVLMLALPGPGVITIVAGILLMDGAAKHALVRKLFSNAHVCSTVDALRRRAGQPPLVRP